MIQALQVIAAHQAKRRKVMMIKRRKRRNPLA
jgi:hypothetical protein